MCHGIFIPYDRPAPFITWTNLDVFFYTVRPPVAAITDDATNKAMSLCCRTLAINRLVTNDSSVPPRESRKNNSHLDKKTLKKSHKFSFGPEVIFAHFHKHMHTGY